MVSSVDREKYGLPPRLFLYTVDQIGDMLAIKADTLLHYEGRSPGAKPKDKMLARNVAPSGERPEWRVDEYEFVRWMKHTRIMPMRRKERSR